MFFSSKNGVGLCDTASYNNLSRESSNCNGINKGVTCLREPIVDSGPVIDKATLCDGILLRTPDGGIKSSTIGSPGHVALNSIITKVNTPCGSATSLPTGGYVFWGRKGPGYEGYQVINMDGSLDCQPAEITTCP